MSIPQPLQIWPNHDQIILAYYQLSADELTKKTVEKKQGTISDTGALVVQTGKFTGRSPKDRYLVKDNMTSERVWWGDINIPFSPQDFDSLYKKMLASLTNKTLYARDVFAGADKRYRIGIRIFNETPWANLFVHNMFIQPDEEELKNFQHDWLVLNIPSFQADPKIDHTRQSNFTIVNFSKKVILIG
ncbi:MAG: phosphoenolpyruvate carboxykinase (ATP), partial [Flavobacteriaceae bacterium]